MLPYLKGGVQDSPRKEFFYVNDDGQLVALRFEDWKVVLMEQRAKTMALWAEPFVELRAGPRVHVGAGDLDRIMERLTEGGLTAD